MRMGENKRISSEDMVKVTGGVGASAGVVGMENYPTEQKTCPECGSSRLIYKTFTLSEGTGKIGQHCEECGNEWTFGDKTSILN